MNMYISIYTIKVDYSYPGAKSGGEQEGQLSPLRYPPRCASPQDQLMFLNNNFSSYRYMLNLILGKDLTKLCDKMHFSGSKLNV